MEPELPVVHQGEIWMSIIPLPDGTGMLRRPAAILSNDRYNKKLQEVLVIPFTTQFPPKKARYKLEIRDWAESGLNKPSVIKPQICPVYRGLMLYRMGRLSMSTFAELQQQIATWF